jgi:integrase
MSGSIEKRGENSWRLVVSGGYDSKGKRIKYRKTISTSGRTEAAARKEAEKELAKFIAEVETGQVVTTSTIKFCTFVDLWINKYAEKNLEPKTYARYKAMLDSRILPFMGHLQLGQIKPVHLINFYSNLQENGIRLDKKYIAKKALFEHIEKLGFSMTELSEKSGVSIRTLDKLQSYQDISSITAQKISIVVNKKISDVFEQSAESSGLSEKTIKHHHQLIATILQYAVKWQYLAYNPALRVDPPKVKKKETLHYEDEETFALLAALDEEPIKYKTMVILDVTTGMRRGELMGLKWKSINLENGIIDINRTNQYVSGIGVLTKDPKNESSNRLVSMPPFTIELLKQYKKWQDGEKEKAGDFWEDGDWIFTQWNGKPMHPDTISQWFPEFIRRCKLPKITFHGLRHTNASLLINSGMDIKSISSHLGHSSTSTTLNVYAHQFRTAEKESAERLQKLLARNDNLPK